MQGNWINGATDKENKLTNNVAVQLPMQQRLYNFENLTSSYGFSKMVSRMFGKDILKNVIYAYFFCSAMNELIVSMYTICSL